MCDKKKLFHGLKFVLWIGFAMTVFLIAMYPIPNQPVTVIVDTGGESVDKTITFSELESTTDLTISFPQISQKEIREIRIYRQLKSICVEKIVSSNLWQYVQIDEDSISFNEDAIELLRKKSKSALIERLLIAETALAITLLLHILINAAEEKFDLDNRNNHGPIYEIKRFCGDIVKYREYMFFAAKADLKAEVANSYLNRLWWILEPFFNMLVYVIVFGNIMGANVQNYATFVFAALLMWNYFSHIVNYSVKCVRNNRDIVTKIYVPKYVLLITNMILNFIKLMFSLLVLIMMLMIFRVHIGVGVLYIIPATLLMLLFAFGAGMILLHYGVFIDDLSYAVGILLQMAMFLTGIFFEVITTLPTPLNSIMLCINPCTVFIDSMRNALLYNMISNVPLVVVWIMLSLLISYIGIHIVYKNENGYVKVI